MRFFLIFTTLLFSNLVFAQSTSSPKCISLEGVHLGCVPALNHPCLRLVVNNVEEITPDNPTGTPSSENYNCMYIKEIKHERRNPNAGPIGLECQSWKPGGAPRPGNETGVDKNAMCNVFFQPVCDQVCTLCTPEQRFYSMPNPLTGCDIQSSGQGECTGACRNRCGDEPYAGGVRHQNCGGPKFCGRPPNTDFTACLVNIPSCPGTFPGTPAMPPLIPPSPADASFLNTKDIYQLCSNIEKCPAAVDYRGGAITPLPDGSIPECTTNSGQPVARVGGVCPCLSGGSPVPRNTENGMCPAGAEDSYPVTPVTVTGGDNCPEIPLIKPVEPTEGESCPWVKDFGLVRRDCEAVPCCCQFDPVTKKARTDCEGGCPGGCPGWIEANMGTASTTTTVNSSSLKSSKGSVLQINSKKTKSGKTKK